MKKRMILTVMTLTVLMALTAYADATFSQYWKQDASGNWYVEKPDGTKVKDAWLCDDAVASNGKDVWYLLDQNGNMLTAGLVQDGTGNFYSLETEHNGYYGMLRYKSGTYGGTNLTLEGSHGGAFAAVLNQDGIDSLKARYGLTSVANISNANIVYTSSFGSGTASQSQSAAQQTDSASSTEERLKYLREYYGMPDETEDQKYEKMMHVIFDLGRSYGDMANTPLTYAFLVDFLSKTDWPNMSVRNRVEAAFNATCCDDNGYGKKGYNNGNYYQGALSAERNSGEWQVAAYHHGVCGDYVRALEWLLDLMGVGSEEVPCRLNGQPHRVLRVNIDGVTYQLDPTNPEPKSAGFDANLMTLSDPRVTSMEYDN